MYVCMKVHCRRVSLFLTLFSATPSPQIRSDQTQTFNTRGSIVLSMYVLRALVTVYHTGNPDSLLDTNEYRASMVCHHGCRLKS